MSRCEVGQKYKANFGPPSPSKVAAYIEDMQDVKSPKDVLKSVYAAVDEAVELLRDDKAILDVRFLAPLMERS
eukprot:s4806_g1.t1